MRFTCALLASLILSGCSKNIQNKEAVKQAVVEYLNARAGSMGLDMSKMDVDVTAMTFERDEARASVYFKLKEMDGGMRMNYTLDRKGDKWVVRSRQDAAPHGGSGFSGEAADPGQLPAGHPPVGSKQ